jgi:group I intron endonuclease
MTCGIYYITNIINHKVYIGNSKNIEKRWWNHRSLLKKNNHFNEHLQYSYNKYGVDNFKLFILEICLPEKLEEREKFWIKELKAFEPEYGYNLTAGGNEDRKIREEVKIKIKKNIKNRVGKNNSFFGKRHSEESKQIMSEKKKGIIPWNKGKILPPISEYHKKRLVESNTGRHPSEETKRKISQSEKRTKQERKANINGDLS